MGKSYDVAFNSISLRAIITRRSFNDKGFIVSSAEVRLGVCVGLRDGLPSSVFLSEIFEWDQTVTRSTLTLKHTQAHSVAHMHVRRGSHVQLDPAWLQAAPPGGMATGEMESLL